MKKLLIILILLKGISLFGQTDHKDTAKSNERFCKSIDENPKFDDSDNPELLLDFINKTLKYPQIAIDKCIQGIVIVGFVVDSIGRVDTSSILRSVDKDCDLEALRIVYLTNGHWTPGKIKDKNVNTSMSVPVRFEIKIGCKSINDYNKSGDEKYKKGLYRDAITDYNEILKLRYNDQDILFKKAKCYIKLNNIDDACQILKTVYNKEAQKLKVKYCK